jgi:flagellar biosynthesis chaperone FliJ
MSNGNAKSGAKLAIVSRLYELQLEQARVDRAAADEYAERQRELAKQIQSRIDEAYCLALDRMRRTSGVLADELRQTGSYTSWQTRTLAEQQKRVREAEQAAEDAIAEVTRRYQALSAIEQLRERRAQDAAVEAARADQKVLDEHALLRLSSAHA